MRMFAKAILVLLVSALLLTMLPLGLAQVEKRPVEAAAENLFNKGIGNAWVGGDPFASSTGTGSDQLHGAASLDSDYRIIGYLNVASGLIVASDGGNSLHFTPGPGNYPVYGYFKADKMVGIFIDFNLL
ncbi:MAG: hypothetical protein M0Q13_03475 [Methanothrix sp.]|nr:hypothetical protein [Methanothrix sp.]